MKFQMRGEIVRDGTWVHVEKKTVESAVQDGKIRILVATDASLGGLNLQAMDGVINYDIP